MDKKSILIVEDQLETLAWIQELLRRSPEFRGVRGAASVPEALREISKHRPDLVFLDEVLPGVPAISLVSELKVLEIPFFLLTSLEAPAHELLPGALGRVRKPEKHKNDTERFERQLTELAKKA